MKNISYILLLLITFIFVSCGGGGSSSFKNETLDITVSCVSNPSSNDFSTYIVLNSGDKIVNDEVGTKVTTYHNVNGEKKVCLNSGKAHIVRK